MGIALEGIRIDPNITEGHPGYEESSDSEIVKVSLRTKPDKQIPVVPSAVAKSH